MLPQERVLADIRKSARLSDYGNVVTYRHPRDNGIRYIGRIVGLAGDRVEMRGGLLHLNDKAVAREARDLAPFLRSRVYAATLRQYEETLPNGRKYMVTDDTRVAAENIPQFVVPAGSVFVLPDNCAWRGDLGRGNVPVANIVGILETIAGRPPENQAGCWPV